MLYVAWVVEWQRPDGGWTHWVGSADVECDPVVDSGMIGRMAEKIQAQNGLPVRPIITFWRRYEEGVG